jgi:hypothetical protein
MKKKYLIIICALMLRYCTAFTQIPTDSLVAFYPFDGNANDTSGHGFNGSLNGQILVAGQCAKAYKFSGNFIDCGDPVGNDLDLVNDATISLWMKFYSLPPSAPAGYFFNYYTLIGKDVGGGDHDKWFLATYNDQLLFHVNASVQSEGYFAAQPVFSFALGTFYHVALTKTGNTYQFYVNGVSYGSKTLPYNIVDVASNLRIGDLDDGSQFLNAAIDEVLIYRRALNLSEINQLYAHCPAGPITSSENQTQDQPTDFKIYPNPSTGKFVLSFANQMIEVKDVSVFNVLGEKVFEQKFRLYNRDVIIDLGNKPKGVYLLQVQTKKKIMVSKIAVQ